MKVTETADLILTPAGGALAPALAAYYARNRDFLAGFEPRREPEALAFKALRARLEGEAAAAAEGRAFHFYLARQGAPETLIGSVALTQIVRGNFLSCFLGYKLDTGHLCRGYMTQAVGAVCRFAFDELGLHRIEGNVMPRNRASIRVLEKCGFVPEGLARRYLRINGVWEDHVHWVLLNEDL